MNADTAVRASLASATAALDALVTVLPDDAATDKVLVARDLVNEVSADLA